MPTYDYECTRCGHAFEEFREMSAPPRSRCPRCRGRVQRVVGGGAGIVFRGSGWYVTDSRARPGPKAAPAGGAGTASPPAKGDGGKPGPAKSGAGD